MKQLLCVMLAAAMSFGASGIAVGAGKKKDQDAAFKKLDKNGDKKISLEEFVGKKTGEKKTKAEKRFKKRDKNNDNFLSLEEFKGKKKK